MFVDLQIVDKNSSNLYNVWSLGESIADGRRSEPLFVAYADGNDAMAGSGQSGYRERAYASAWREDRAV